MSFMEEAQDDWANAIAQDIFDVETEGLTNVTPEDVPDDLWIRLERAIYDLGDWINQQAKKQGAA